MMEKKLRIGVSSCLMGEEVRFNGGHCHHRFVTQELGEYSEFVPSCPEAAIGMGIPRESVRLEYHVDNSIRMVAPKSRKDFTEDMLAYSQERTQQLLEMDLDGYVFKKDSPSCGVFRAKIYKGDQPAQRRGTGLFADTLMKAYPEMPVEEEGRLSDPLLREHFVTRVFAFRRVKDLFAEGWRRKDVVAFHSREKYLLMAFSPKGYRALGRLVGEIKSYSPEEFKTLYIKAFMEALSEKASKGRHTNTLQHMAGYLKKRLSDEGKQELVEAIGSYNKGLTPLVVPLTLLRHMLRRFDEEYLLQQSYLAPHPHELALRNYV